MDRVCPNHSEALTGHSASTRRIEPTCEVARAGKRNGVVGNWGVSQQILTVGDEKSPNNKSNRELGSDLLTFDIQTSQDLVVIRRGESVHRRIR